MPLVIFWYSFALTHINRITAYIMYPNLTASQIKNAHLILIHSLNVKQTVTVQVNLQKRQSRPLKRSLF